MADTSIEFRNELGMRVPSIEQIAVQAGDTLTLSATEGADTMLYFSSDAVSVLNPRPRSPLSLTSGTTATFAFTTSAAGAYAIISQAPNAGGLVHFPQGKAAILTIQPDTPVVMAMPHGRIQG